MLLPLHRAQHTLTHLTLLKNPYTLAHEHTLHDKERIIYLFKPTSNLLSIHKAPTVPQIPNKLTKTKMIRRGSVISRSDLFLAYHAQRSSFLELFLDSNEEGTSKVIAYVISIRGDSETQRCQKVKQYGRGGEIVPPRCYHWQHLKSQHFWLVGIILFIMWVHRKRMFLNVTPKRFG